MWHLSTLPFLRSMCRLPVRPCPHPRFEYRLRSDSCWIYVSPPELLHRSIHSVSIWNSQSRLRLSMSKNMSSVPNLDFLHASHPPLHPKLKTGSTIRPGTSVRNLGLILGTNPFSSLRSLAARPVGCSSYSTHFSPILRTFRVLPCHGAFARAVCWNENPSPELLFSLFYLN